MMETASNVFTDGITSDLHPLSTPETKMTSALNATTITYNGNEQLLQNDMGNTMIQDALTGNVMGLSEGFIPVGMKEYGGILYIASLKPVRDAEGNITTTIGELGTIPSPKIQFLFGDQQNFTHGGINLVTSKEDSTHSYSDGLGKGYTESGLNTLYDSVEQNPHIVTKDCGDTSNDYGPLKTGDQFMIVLDLDGLLDASGNEVSFKRSYHVDAESDGGAIYKQDGITFPLINTFVKDGNDYSLEYGWYSINLYSIVPGKQPVLLSGITDTPQSYYIEGEDNIQTSKYWFINAKDIEGKTIDILRSKKNSDKGENLYKKYPNILRGQLAIKVEPNVPKNIRIIKNNSTKLHTPFTCMQNVKSFAGTRKDITIVDLNLLK